MENFLEHMVTNDRIFPWFQAAQTMIVPQRVAEVTNVELDFLFAQRLVNTTCLKGNKFNLLNCFKIWDHEKS